MDNMEERDRLQLTALRADMVHLIKSLDELKDQIKSLAGSHTTHETFGGLRDRVALMEKIVFGALGVVLISVLGAILLLVIKK